MSDMFQTYERQYLELQSNIKQGCAAAGALTEGIELITRLLELEYKLSEVMQTEQRRTKLLELKAALNEGDSLIRRMDLEARGLQQAQKIGFLNKLKDYKAALTNSKREVKMLSMGGDLGARNQLFEGGPITASQEQRVKLAATTDRTYQTGERIKEGRKVLMETEELGVSILQDLHRQRETLLHARDTLHGVDDNIARGKVIIHNISRRITRNKYITASLIAFVLFAILLILTGKKHH